MLGFGGSGAGRVVSFWYRVRIKFCVDKAYADLK